MLPNRKKYKYRLAAIGDSMTLGFKNGGVYRTDLNFPRLLANCFDPPLPFDQPSFSGQAGIPINMEMLVRGLQEEVGDELSWNKTLAAGSHIYRTLRRIKKYWEGDRLEVYKERQEPWHNQSVWGFAASDNWLMTEKKCREFLINNEPRYTVFSVLPDNAMYITGRIILNPALDSSFENSSLLDNIRFLSDHGGIENLIVCTGHNNIVGAVTNLELIYSEETGLNAFYSERQCTLYRPEHFEIEMRNLYEQIAAMKIKRVFVPTIPYLTIPPAIRGVNIDSEKNRESYFDYYTRFWIWDEDFDPGRHPHITKEEAIELDQNVDQYNTIIRKLAGEFDFYVVPVHKHVSAVARRRRGDEDIRAFPPEFCKALKNNPDTAYLVGGNHDIRISTDYLRLGDDGLIERGGIFSLDGLHPTTIGYGLIANIYWMTMNKYGVKFDREIDWDFIIENDTLITNPPILLKDLRLLLRFLSLGRQERFTMFSKNILQQLMEMFSFRKQEPEILS
ncbi:MAG: hypothetical protein ACFCU6_13850 [Balneolaceae bacterium]